MQGEAVDSSGQRLVDACAGSGVCGGARLRRERAAQSPGGARTHEALVGFFKRGRVLVVREMTAGDPGETTRDANRQGKAFARLLRDVERLNPKRR